MVTTAFQFHKGAIRTCRYTPQVSRSIWFQFHKGAIRTHYDKDCNILVHNGVW